MNYIVYLLIIVSVSLSVTAQICLKQGMASVAVQTALKVDVQNAVIAILTSIPVLAGLFAYVTSAGIWLLVLSKIDVSKAYPFVGLGFIGTMLFAYWFLNEPLSIDKILGTFLIVTGIYFISR